MHQDYKQSSLAAFKKSKELGLEPKINFNKPITGELTNTLNYLFHDKISTFLLQRFGSGYWGQNCINIAPQLFGILQYLGISCELVYGDVSIMGTDECDTTLSGLLKELISPGVGEFVIHVWLQIGKDLIIDPTVAARINKYYIPDFNPHKIVLGRSKKLYKELRLEYKPMLVGANYLAKVCGIPLEYNADAA